MVGIRSSPPATPSRAATFPMKKPAMTPAMMVAIPGWNNPVELSCRGIHASESITNDKITSRIRMILSSQIRDIFIALPAAHHAPIRLPASKLITISRCANSWSTAIDFVRNIKATVTTVRLIALLNITASRVGILKLPIRTGRRNSAPPRPIKPPKAPISVPDKNPFPFRFSSDGMCYLSRYVFFDITRKVTQRVRILEA